MASIDVDKIILKLLEVRGSRPGKTGGQAQRARALLFLAPFFFPLSRCLYDAAHGRRGQRAQYALCRARRGPCHGASDTKAATVLCAPPFLLPLSCAVFSRVLSGLLCSRGLLRAAVACCAVAVALVTFGTKRGGAARSAVPCHCPVLSCRRRHVQSGDVPPSLSAFGVITALSSRRPRSVGPLGLAS